MTFKDLLDTLASDETLIATDNDSIKAATAALAMANASLSSDTDRRVAARHAIGAVLQADGPRFILGTDGSASVYVFDTTNDFQVFTAKGADTPNPDPAPAPTPPVPPPG